MEVFRLGFIIRLPAFVQAIDNISVCWLICTTHISDKTDMLNHS